MNPSLALPPLQALCARSYPITRSEQSPEPRANRNTTGTAPRRALTRRPARSAAARTTRCIAATYGRRRLLLLHRHVEALVLLGHAARRRHLRAVDECAAVVAAARVAALPAAPDERGDAVAAAARVESHQARLDNLDIPVVERRLRRIAALAVHHVARVPN